MTRTVFDNSMTAHIWAQQNQRDGNSHNGNFWFCGRSIYSYGTHYCAGYALPTLDGGTLYLWNADSSSQTTTGKHLPAVRRAAGYQGHAVPGLTELARLLDRWADRDDTATARRNRAFPDLRRELADHWPGEEAAAAILAAMGARSPAKGAAAMARKVKAAEAKAAAKRDKQARDKLARDAKATAGIPLADFRRRVARELGAYHSAERAREVLASDGRKLFRQIKEAKARGWTRVAAELKARRAIVRDVVKAADKRHAAAYRNRNRRRSINRYRESVATLESHDTSPDMLNRVRPGDYEWSKCRAAAEVAAAAADLSRHVPLTESTLARLASIQSAARAQSEELKAAHVRIRNEENAARIKAWREGEEAGPGQGRFRFDSPHGGAAVRAVDVQRDDTGAIVGGTLQTSHGADVPLPHAIRAFRFLKHCRDTGTAWAANGRTLRVGHFRVDRVEASGDFVAGCHRIAWAEVEALARGLGVLDLPPADTTESSHAAA